MQRASLPRFRLLAPPFLALFALAACSEVEPEPAGMQAPVATAADGAAPEAVTASPASDARSTSPESVAEPQVVASDSVVLGTRTSDEGLAVGAKPVYASSDTVHVSLPVAGHASAGQEVTVYWTDSATGATAKQETLQVEPGAQYVTFAFAPADGLAPGAYNVQVDVDDVPAGFADFRVE